MSVNRRATCIRQDSIPHTTFLARCGLTAILFFRHFGRKEPFLAECILCPAKRPRNYQILTPSIIIISVAERFPLFPATLAFLVPQQFPSLSTHPDHQQYHRIYSAPRFNPTICPNTKPCPASSGNDFGPALLPPLCTADRITVLSKSPCQESIHHSSRQTHPYFGISCTYSTSSSFRVKI